MANHEWRADETEPRWLRIRVKAACLSTTKILEFSDLLDIAQGPTWDILGSNTPSKCLVYQNVDVVSLNRVDKLIILQLLLQSPTVQKSIT